MSRGKARVDRIRSEVSTHKLLMGYGYALRADAGDHEEQFPCDLHGGHDNTPSARFYPSSNSWHCVAVRERVLTARGWVELGRLSEETELPVLDGASDWKVPVAYLPRGEREVVRVKTTAGYEVTVTPDHEIDIEGRGWVRADEIRPGDVIIVPKPKRLMFNEDYSLLRYDVASLNQTTYTHQSSLNLPQQWDVNLGEVLGYLFGDGWVIVRGQSHSNTVGLTTHSKDVEDARRIFKQMQHWTGGRGSETYRDAVVKCGGKNYVQDQYVFTIGNDGFVSFLHKLGLTKPKPSNTRRLPESVWSAPECGIKGFLRGIFATDGSVFKPKGRKGVRVNLYSVSDGFLRDVQLLLLQFGIHSRVHAPSSSMDSSGKRTHPCGYLQIATGGDILLFRERVGIANLRKQEILDSYKIDPRGQRPFKAIVESVTPAGVATVADISMPVEHSFVAGGVKVHNCFGCGRTRDAIQTVIEKEGVDFWDAVRFLEKKFRLPQLPWDADVARPMNMTDVVHDALKERETVEEVSARAERMLFFMKRDGDVDHVKLLHLWEAHDRILYGHRREGWKDDQTVRLLTQLIERITHAQDSQGTG